MFMSLILTIAVSISDFIIEIYDPCMTSLNSMYNHSLDLQHDCSTEFISRSYFCVALIKQLHKGPFRKKIEGYPESLELRLSWLILC